MLRILLKHNAINSLVLSGKLKISLIKKFLFKSNDKYKVTLDSERKHQYQNEKTHPRTVSAFLQVQVISLKYHILKI